MSNFFILKSSDHDGSTSIYLLGPEYLTQNQFVELTESLVSYAARLALEKQQESSYPSFVGGNEILEQISNLLCSYHGFSLFEPKISSFYGHCITFDPTCYDERYDRDDFEKLISTENKQEIIEYHKLLIKVDSEDEPTEVKKMEIDNEF